MRNGAVPMKVKENQKINRKPESLPLAPNESLLLQAPHQQAAKPAADGAAELQAVISASNAVARDRKSL